ncbi:MAG: hypothetical protein ACRCUM_04030, partial [Mycoplasmoidaceae bacterium]
SLAEKWYVGSKLSKTHSDIIKNNLKFISAPDRFDGKDVIDEVTFSRAIVFPSAPGQTIYATILIVTFKDQFKIMNNFITVRVVSLGSAKNF